MLLNLPHVILYCSFQSTCTSVYDGPLRNFILHFKINTINILNIISHYKFSFGQYLFTHSKYELQHQPEVWPGYPNTVFAFLLIKILIQKQLCQQLVKPNTHICFCFLAYKNYNAGATVPAAGQVGYTYAFSLFYL